MKILIDKKLILEDYMQDMIDGVSHSDALNKHGVDINDYIQDERLLDKTKPSTPGSNILKSKYDLFDDPNKTSMRIIRSISNKHGLDYEKSIDNAHTFLKTVGHIENDNKVHGSNHVKNSTIEGLYQISEPQAETARARFHRDYKLDHIAPYLTKEGAVPVKDMTAQQQTAMVIAGLAGHGNSNNNLQHFSRMLAGNESSAKDMYYTDHHTAPDKATHTRAENIFEKMKLKH